MEDGVINGANEKKEEGGAMLKAGTMCRSLNIHFASGHFETGLPLAVLPGASLARYLSPNHSICRWTRRIMTLFTPHYPVNK